MAPEARTDFIFAVMSEPIVALAYLIAGICFIVALRGLSSPASSQRGNRFGMAGMAIAVVTTLLTHGVALDFTNFHASYFPAS